MGGANPWQARELNYFFLSGLGVTRVTLVVLHCDAFFVRNHVSATSRALCFVPFPWHARCVSLHELETPGTDRNATGVSLRTDTPMQTALEPRERPAAPIGHAIPTFASCIRDLRTRCCGKQLWLAHAMGCTEATVSYWEAGRRLPSDSTFPRLVLVLTQAGAHSADVDRLQDCWRAARRDQSQRRRRGQLRRRASLGPQELMLC